MKGRMKKVSVVLYTCSKDARIYLGPTPGLTLVLSDCTTTLAKVLCITGALRNDPTAA